MSAKKYNRKIDSKELMSVIKKNTELGPCINAFETLIEEVPMEVGKSCKSCMMNFLDDILHHFKDIDRVQDRSNKSKMLDWSYIKPERYFGNLKAQVLKYYTKVPEMRASSECFNPALVVEGKDREDARRTLLVWRNVPAVCKAVIQTKRRSLGLDRNSKKYGS